MDKGKPTYPILGTPEHVQSKAYIIKEKAIVGNTYTIICPVCGKQMETTPDKKGKMIVHCPNKDSIIGYGAKIQEKETGDIKNDAPVPTTRGISQQTLKHNGCLEWGGFLSKKSAKLHVGTNTIGRKDDEEPSEISFKDDYMSRKSITIDVEKDPNRSGYTFKLSVLRAANPVLVGSHSLQVGNSIYLNYGDTIKLGNTVLTFKESKV